MTRKTTQRQAHVRFRGVETFKEEGRDARGLAWLDPSRFQVPRTLSLDARAGRGRPPDRGCALGSGRLQPVVLLFTRAQSDLNGPLMVWLMRAGQFLIGAPSFLVAINLAVLLYARIITRLGEITVRTALGASRGRILSQLFVEALVLTTLGAAAGLVILRTALTQVEAMAGVVPSWWKHGLTPSTVLSAFVLAVVAALIMACCRD